MVIAKARKCPDHYSYVSPVIGLHVSSSSHKLQDASISKLSYQPHPCQKELATHTDQNAVTKSLQHDCYLSTDQRSVTNSCYSTPAPCQFKDKSSAPPKEQSSAADLDSQQHTMKKMADTYKYVSTVFVKPDKLTLEPNHTTHQSSFTPVSLEFLKEKRAGIPHKDMHASSNQGVRLSDPKVQSEYNYRFVMPKGAPGTRKMDQDGVRGCAKLNVTHNTITGDRFNFGNRKIGTTHHHDEYCPRPVEQRNLENTSAIRNITSSIPKGDPDKEYQRQSSSHHSYQKPSCLRKDLRFNTLSETHQKTFRTSFKYKSGAPEDFSTTTMDYSSKINDSGKAAKIAGSAWTRGASSLPEGDLDRSRVHKIQGDITTRASYVTPPTDSYRKHVDYANMITQGTLQLGSPEFRPTSRVTTSGASYMPHEIHRQHIIQAPKDKMIITPCKDFAQTSATHKDFQPNTSTTRASKAYAEVNKFNSNFDYSSRWGLLSREPSSYSTTQQAHFSNPATRVYLA